MKRYLLAAVAVSLIGLPIQAQPIELSVTCENGRVTVRFFVTDPVESLRAWLNETEIVNERNPKVPYTYQQTHDAPTPEIVIKVQADESVSTASVTCGESLADPQASMGSVRWGLLIALLVVGGLLALALRQRRKSQPA